MAIFHFSRIPKYRYVKGSQIKASNIVSHLLNVLSYIRLFKAMICVLMKSQVSKEYDEISKTSCVRQYFTVQCAWPDFRKSQSESLLLRKQQTKIWIQIGPDWVQTVWIGYQQTTNVVTTVSPMFTVVALGPVACKTNGTGSQLTTVNIEGIIASNRLI